MPPKREPKGRDAQREKKDEDKRKKAERGKAAAQAAKQEQRTRVKEMIDHGVFYLTMANSKKVPLKRADFNRIVCGDEKTREILKKVLNKVQDICSDVFGIDVYALNDQTFEYDTDLMVPGRSSFMLVSQFKSKSLVNQIDGLDSDEREREGGVRGALLIILTIIFMNYTAAGAPEAQLWTILTRLKLHDPECLNIMEKDFTKFLKTEFVSTYYLRSEETTDEQNGVTNIRYFWGPRSECEFSKADVLMYAVQTLPNTLPTDFPHQYQIIMNSPEKEYAEQIFTAWAQTFVGETGASGSDTTPEESENEAASESYGSDEYPSPTDPSESGEPGTESENDDSSEINDWLPAPDTMSPGTIVGEPETDDDEDMDAD